MWPFTKKHNWWYFHYPDIYQTRNNIRICVNTGVLQILDIDGWCHFDKKNELEVRSNIIDEMSTTTYRLWLQAISGKKWKI